MCIRSELLEGRLDPRILGKRVDEGAHGIPDRPTGMLGELREPCRLEPMLDPWPVTLEIEFRCADEKITRAEPLKRLHPGAVRPEILPKLHDVGRPWGDDTPSEDADPLVRCWQCQLLRRVF